MFNITRRALQYKGLTCGFDGDNKLIPTLGKDVRPEQIGALRGTYYTGGYYKSAENGAFLYFAKPNMGSRATDCFSSRGPQPSITHVVGNGLVLFSW